MKEIALIGAGGHAKVIIEIIESAGDKVVFINDTDERTTSVLGYPVSVDNPAPDTPVVISIGSNRVRKRIADGLANPVATATHLRANLSSRCSIGEGTVVMAGATINSDTVVGRHCIVNTNASIDHDCRIGDYVHIAPNVAIAGGVAIGEGSMIGIGTSVIPGITIGAWVTIGAGSVIIADVPDHAVVVGVPGDIIKYNQ